MRWLCHHLVFDIHFHISSRRLDESSSLTPPCLVSWANSTTFLSRSRKLALNLLHIIELSIVPTFSASIFCWLEVLLFLVASSNAGWFLAWKWSSRVLFFLQSFPSLKPVMCLIAMCSRRLLDWANQVSQIVHRWVLTFKWIDLTCVWRCPFWANFLSQWGQELSSFKLYLASKVVFHQR